VYPDNLAQVFYNNALFVFDDPWKTSQIHLQSRGDLVVTSGNIVVICPYMEPDWPPFTISVPLGRFPVVESLQYVRYYNADMLRDVDPETQPFQVYQSLGAMVSFRAAPPVRWRLARLPQWSDAATQALDLQQDVYGGYLNTKGYSMCFMDADTGAILAERIKRDDAYSDRLYEQIEDDELTEIVIDEGSGGNLVAFGQGGQGVSPAFFGYAADGRLARLVVDVAFNARTLLTEGVWQPPAE
jgi:hypothetical protein